MIIGYQESPSDVGRDSALHKLSNYFSGGSFVTQYKLSNTFLLTLDLKALSLFVSEEVDRVEQYHITTSL